ncbi:hypothetical protein SAMN05421736_1347 [Evansella caseinilytica]|uniref:WD40 repeat protein n=1 Tax=Evansella caseinilytica TaxID=1503961 RepID=A0A1H3V0W1_9BACI|nr:hypothetical protein [Evansella caseinilytica]SDZ68340.1 hypothetical protein SAMN05421736_1347 [Evansella caseinilytica]
MKRKLLTVLSIIFVLLLIGCTREEDKIESANQAAEKSDSPVQPPPPLEAESNVNVEQINGDIKNIYYAGEGKVLLSADKLYLFDADTESVLAEAPQESFERERFWVIDSGYVAVRETLSSDNDGSMMTNGEINYNAMFYDDELNKVSEYEINELVEADDMLMFLEAISFSSDGTKIAYATYSGVYIYDFEKDSKITVIDLEAADTNERSGIVNIEQIGFTKEDKRIAFKAQSFDIPAEPYKPSFDTCGTVNIDSSDLSNRTFDDYTCKQLTSYSNLLLLAEDPTMTTGRLMVMDTISGQAKMHTLTEEEESGNVSGSDGGAFFATSSRNKNGFTVRVYNADTGQVEGEQQVEVDEKSPYLSHDPVVKVLDDIRTWIILLGSKRDDVEAKMIISHF